MWIHVPREHLSASAPESGGLISGSSEPVEWSLWCTSSGRPLLRPSSWPGWRRRSWHRLLFGTTCAPSTLARGVAWWISSLAEHRARTSVSPGSALGWMAHAPDSSSSTSGSPSNARPHSSSGRTSPEQLGLFPESASILRTVGTEARGPSFERVTLAPLINEPESSCWPTATSMDARASGAAGYSVVSGRHSGTTLTDAAVRLRQWPTPQASDVSGPRPLTEDGTRSLANGGRNLKDVTNFWPTPTSNPWKSGEASEDAHRRNARPLNEVACRSDLQGLTTEMDGLESSLSAQTSHRPSLNPAFVEWLMGWPERWTLPYVRTDSEPVETE